MSEIVKSRESAANARAYFVANLVCDAVFNQDIDVCKQIITRIDGAVPDEESRSGYANIFGDALDDVLGYEKADQLQIYPEDLGVIAIAKVVIFSSMKEVGRNFQMRKSKNDAIDLILNRVGGRKTKPTKPLLETTFEDPDWMKLPASQEKGE